MLHNLPQTIYIRFRSPFPIGTAPMFTFTTHCVSPPPRQVRLPAPMTLVLSRTTVASRAARRPAPAFAPAPRSPPAPTPTLLTQPAPGAGPLVDNIHGAGKRHATPPAPPLSGKFRRRRLQQRRRPLLSPRRSESPRCAAPTRASRPPALRGRASRRQGRTPARPPAPHAASFIHFVKKAGCLLRSWSRLPGSRVSLGV